LLKILMLQARNERSRICLVFQSAWKSITGVYKESQASQKNEQTNNHRQHIDGGITVMMWECLGIYSKKCTTLQNRFHV
jgi:hypothetical protein